MMGVSLRVIMALTIAVVAAITGVVCFLPTYLTGVDSVSSAVGNVRTSIVTMAEERITAYFNKPRDYVLMMQYLSSRGRLDASNATAMVQLACDLAIDNMNSFTSVTIMMLGDNFYRCDSGPVLREGLPPAIFTLSADRTQALRYLMDPVTRTAVPGSGYVVSPMPTGVPLWALDPVTSSFAVNPSVQVAWTSAAIAWNSTQLSVGSRLTFPNGTWRGAVLIPVNSFYASRFLQTLGLRESGRCIVWDDGTGDAIALSWNEWPVSLYPDWQTQPVAALKGKLRPLDNFTDPLLNRVVSSLGGPAAVRSLPTPYSSSIGSGKGLVFVDITWVRDSYGLNVKILMMMPKIDFLRDVYAQQTRTLAGECCGAAAMIAIAFVIGHFMAAPLQRLADRMQLTASFQDEEADDPPSVLSEVAAMQASYSQMKSQLNMAKTYLPQSVMAKADDDDEDEDESAAVLSDGRLTASHRRSTSGRRSQSSASLSKSGRPSVLSSESGRGAGATALNLELGLTLRSVTVVSFNLQGFMSTAVASARRCAEIQEAMLGTVQRVIRDNKGVIDYFQGDRVLASFNAVTNVVAHSRRGLVAAMTAVRELKALPNMPKATVGISSGMALCGNMGTAEMRRFCVVGYPVVQALLLERMTKLYRGVSVLMPGWMEPDAQLDLYYLAVDIVALPGGGGKLDRTANRGISLVLAPMSLKSVATDEWMYELKQGEDANPFRHVNAGLKAVLAGDIEAAKHELSQRADADVDSQAAAGLATHIQRAAEAGGAPKPTDLGPLFTQPGGSSD